MNLSLPLISPSLARDAVLLVLKVSSLEEFLRVGTSAFHPKSETILENHGTMNSGSTCAYSSRSK